MHYYNDIYQQLFLSYSLRGLVGGGAVNAAWVEFSLLIYKKSQKTCINIVFLKQERPQKWQKSSTSLYFASMG